MKTCERCPSQAVKHERFCKACKAVVLSEMKASRYLTTKVMPSSGRGQDKAENVRETKYGVD